GFGLQQECAVALACIAALEGDAKPLLLRAADAGDLQRPLRREHVAILPGRLRPEALAGIVAGSPGEGAGGPRHLADADVHIFGTVRRFLAGPRRLGRDRPEQAGGDHRLAQIVDLAAVVKLAALEAREDSDMLRVEGELALGGEAREHRARAGI